jgi:hypothetical protein
VEILLVRCGGANIELIDAIIERRALAGEAVGWWLRGQPRRTGDIREI